MTYKSFILAATIATAFTACAKRQNTDTQNAPRTVAKESPTSPRAVSVTIDADTYVY